jgi:GDPmannose 4,6-dehydratase
MKKALIFGINGQDGSFLAEILLSKGYVVHGVIRKTSQINTKRLEKIYQDPHEKNYRLKLHYGDVTDSLSVSKIIGTVKPQEIYNLAAQSHVAVSFEVPEYTANVDGIGTLRILEAIRFCNLEKKTKFYQAGTSELFGKVKSVPQNEKTPFYPQSPYAVAKLYAHWITKIYREAYGIFACNGILFNHESYRRGETFVTKKIISGLCKIQKGKQNKIYLGNLYSKRDWGHAKDYCLAMWKMLQQKKPQDFVISTGKQYTIKQFVNFACKEIGIDIIWVGKNFKEKALIKNSNKIIIEIDKKYYRPLDVHNLLGNSKVARKKLRWKPKYNIYSLIKEMVKKELENS